MTGRFGEGRACGDGGESLVDAPLPRVHLGEVGEGDRDEAPRERSGGNRGADAEAFIPTAEVAFLAGDDSM